MTTLKEQAYLEKIRNLECDIDRLEQALSGAESRAMHYRDKFYSVKDDKEELQKENSQLKSQIHIILGKQVNEDEYHKLQVKYDKLAMEMRKLKKELKTWLEGIKI